MNTPTFDINKTDTPCYVTEECYLKRNCEILKSVQDMTGCKILLAQKAFSMYSTYPLISGYIPLPAAFFTAAFLTATFLFVHASSLSSLSFLLIKRHSLIVPS